MTVNNISYCKHILVYNIYPLKKNNFNIVLIASSAEPLQNIVLMINMKSVEFHSC